VLPAALAGIWAATGSPPLVYRWIPPINETLHYFLVVTRRPDGTISAFVRNPEMNAGVALGTRTVIAHHTALYLQGPGKPDVLASFSGSALTIQAFPAAGSALTFHRASAPELRWYYPSADVRWRYREPPALGDGWPVGTLASAGLREAALAPVMQSIVALRSPELRSPYIQSIAIARRGRLVLDEYFYGYTPDTPHDVRSAGKSVTGLLVGRAIEETHVLTPQTPVLSYLPQYLPVANDDARKRRITVANLMTMSSGLACDDNDDNSPGNEDSMQSQTAQPDWYKYTLDLPMAYDPGARAVYCSAGINLLGAIVARATNMPLTQFFHDRFAAPMNFGRYAMWLMPKPVDAAYMGGGDRFRPRDFLKFGQLFLSGGSWQGRPIVDGRWLAESVVQRTVMNPDASGGGDRYGYTWHLSTLSVGGRSYDVINAGGNGGQIMAVVPALDMAVMITAGNYNQYPVWNGFLRQVVGAAIRAAQ
jgi:CubicO group peptidase (beta-lactamase class C family)